MDLSDIIYIICLALGIFAPIFQSRAKKKALEKTQRKPQSHPADEEYMPSPQDVYADNADEEYYDELPEEQPQVMTTSSAPCARVARLCKHKWNSPQ